MNAAAPSFFSLFVFSAALAILPLFLLMGTSYAKISIVLFLVRNALGIQQTPPGNILATIAVVLTLFVMAPVIRDVYAVVSNPQNSYQTVQDYEDLAKKAYQPMFVFLNEHARPDAREFFVETTTKVWKDKNMGPVTPDDIFIILPAFLVSELTRAFEIGFLLYLPFLVVDFVVSVIIVAMGMNSLSPTVISTPLKLLLFIAVDGWSRLLQGLVLSYAPPGS
jgi:type III secretion protein R